MATKTDKIRQKIAALQENLKAAQAAEDDRQKATILRVAKRSGLLDAGFSEKQMEAEFRALVKRSKTIVAAQRPGAQSSFNG